MKNNRIYHYKMNRKKRSRLFIRMGFTCLVYIAGLYVYETYSERVVSENFRSIYIYLFSFCSLVLFYIAWWHLKNPAIYEAIITPQRFIVRYPDSPQWSFDVSISDIERFEYRQLDSHTGRGIVMKSGEFHKIVMNYGNSVNKMHAAIKGTNPDVTFFKEINKRSSSQSSKKLKLKKF
jgi:hypothetical protein